jgi:hypothetical protein
MPEWSWQEQQAAEQYRKNFGWVPVGFLATWPWSFPPSKEQVEEWKKKRNDEEGDECGGDVDVYAAITHICPPCAHQWQPIETAKAQGRVRLWLLKASGEQVEGWWSNTEQEWLSWGQGIVDNVTHWMPLPEPPETTVRLG